MWKNTFKKICAPPGFGGFSANSKAERPPISPDLRLILEDVTSKKAPIGEPSSSFVM
jgi:hypothetical protein